MLSHFQYHMLTILLSDMFGAKKICQVDLLGCGAKTRKRPLREIYRSGLMLIIGYRSKPVSSLASKALNSPIIHSQNTVMPSLSAVCSENDFQQSGNPEPKYYNAKPISSRVSEYSQPQPLLLSRGDVRAICWGEDTQAPSSRI